MNIKEAKEQIKNAMVAYFTKNEFGDYIIPIERQRPIFMLGAPGIGKTAIMEQIASELGVGLVTYSMTHHTRQSALGLPFISKKMYGGKEYSVSEYTMSEIIASVYDMIEETGHKEGILFLDEINCVSETLAPAMLQFLQYKIFGRHRVPDGWIVVTAGNPPEYNKSVKVFDTVTFDRLKKIEVEADYDVWKEFAVNAGIHASITTFLDIKKDYFYVVKTNVNSKELVTARGWSDLSDMIHLYEANNMKVDLSLIQQYIQHSDVSKEFAIYYDLFNKYKSDYQVNAILSGTYTDDIVNRAKSSKFDEHLALIGLILDAIFAEVGEVVKTENLCLELLPMFRKIKADFDSNPSLDISKAIQNEIDKKNSYLETGKQASSISIKEQRAIKSAIAFAEDILRKISITSANTSDAFSIIKQDYNALLEKLKSLSAIANTKLSNAFKFIERVYNDGQEMLIFVTELTINANAAHFISKYNNKEYFEHNKNLLFYERQKEIIAQIEDLDL